MISVEDLRKEEACWGVEPRSDFYRWCVDQDMYIKQDEVMALIKQEHIEKSEVPSTKKRFLIVDVRDDDHQGGNVWGSIHCPDSDFVSHMPRLLTTINELQQHGGDDEKIIVIFHCMESIMRGPRCARRLHMFFEQHGQEPVVFRRKSPVVIRVLMGGADRWIRRFHGETTMVENFNDDFWCLNECDDGI